MPLLAMTREAGKKTSEPVRELGDIV